jgi:hypothetical protein
MLYNNCYFKNKNVKKNVAAFAKISEEIRRDGSPPHLYAGLLRFSEKAVSLRGVCDEAIPSSRRDCFAKPRNDMLAADRT